MNKDFKLRVKKVNEEGDKNNRSEGHPSETLRGPSTPHLFVIDHTRYKAPRAEQEPRAQFSTAKIKQRIQCVGQSRA